MTQNQKLYMGNPSFRPDTIGQIAQKLLFALYDNTEGDKWKPVEVIEIYDQEITGSYAPTNEALRNNVLQNLLYSNFISLDENRKKIFITHEGKIYVYKNHPAFKR